jgi:hypothetical protein
MRVLTSRTTPRSLAYFCATSMLEGMKEAGIDSAKVLEQYIKLYNDCIKDVPKVRSCLLFPSSSRKAGYGVRN